MASVLASNFQRLSRASSKLSLSILTRASVISRSRRASSCASAAARFYRRSMSVRISAHRDRRFRDRDRTFRLMMTAHFG
jgi:hypothetical protein